MNDPFRKLERLAGWLAALGVLVLAVGCGRETAVNRLPGYVEGEWVYVAAPVAGTLAELNVRRGDTVAAGAALFRLSPEPEELVWREASERLRQAAARLADLRKGVRPSERAELEARLEQARAAARFSLAEQERVEKLAGQGAATLSDRDQIRTLRDHDRAQITALEAQLVTSGLGGREDAVRAAEAEVEAATAAVAQADWRRAQKRQAAPAAGGVHDTLFRVGEWVPAGAPVVALLPPANVKVRVFVPEPLAATLKPGQAVRVTADGLAPRPATVAFVSDRAEFTPPVLYSRDNRAKLVFLVEARFADGAAAAAAPMWKPGLPVEVEF